ncbi:protein CPR-5 isoform X2 [Impatiens glandulifera]|uniref:protein CPR-5 isoform X2 n=1 Tax=Impatiens glandulifera TaxID=253017 RepID=UPI001FB0EA1D|nr:protein CPR-5 isoform X2 [Impatiens glandulifera]
MDDDPQSSQSPTAVNGSVRPENELITTSEEATHAYNGLKSTVDVSTTSLTWNKNTKKKKKRRCLDASDSASSSTGPSLPVSRWVHRGGIRVSNGKRNPRFLIGSVGQKACDVDTLALPLGMSIAAVISQICKLAVKESIANVYGDKFDPFVENFEKSFRSTLRTLRLVNDSSQITSNRHQSFESGCSSSNVQQDCSHELSDNQDETIQNVQRDPTNREMVLHNGRMSEQLNIFSTNRNYTQSSDLSATSTLEKSVIEQTRLNDLKTLEISLTLRKLELKEKQLSLNSDMNFLERCKLSMGISKASFKAEKFKNELGEKMYSEMLKKSIDLFVAGMIIMLASIAYGAYVYSSERLFESTGSCAPPKESKSWWPKSMFSFNSIFPMIWCHIQIKSRMLFGLLVFLAIIYLLFQRSSVLTQSTMPVTSVLLLAVACGFSGKLCIDTLGGSGYHWLLLWELLCFIHFLSNVCASVVFYILHGPILVNQTSINRRTIFPYWIRQVMFYGLLIFLPLSCGLVPFASLYDWKDHFSSRGSEYFANYWDGQD